MLTETRIVPRIALLAAAVVVLSIVFLAARATAGGGGAPPVVPGPRQLVKGVGVGFADTEPGAEAAAAHYLLELERAIDTLNPARTTAVANLVATTGEARVFESHTEAAIAVERTGGAPLRRLGVFDRSGVLFAGGGAGHRARELDLCDGGAGGAVGDRARIPGLAPRRLAGERDHRGGPVSGRVARGFALAARVSRAGGCVGPLAPWWHSP